MKKKIFHNSSSDSVDSVERKVGFFVCSSFNNPSQRILEEPMHGGIISMHDVLEESADPDQP